MQESELKAEDFTIPRLWVHAVCEACANNIVGEQVEVYWPEDKTWYEGQITKYRAPSDGRPNPKHLISYDDGEESWESLMGDFAEQHIENGHNVRFPQAKELAGGKFAYPGTVAEEVYVSQCKWKHRYPLLLLSLLFFLPPLVFFFFSSSPPSCLYDSSYFYTPFVKRFTLVKRVWNVTFYRTNVQTFMHH